MKSTWRLALALCLAGCAASAANEFVTLVAGGHESPFPSKLRPPGDSGLSGAAVIRFADPGGAIKTGTRYREGAWTLQVDASSPRGCTERSFTIGYEGPGEVRLRRMEVVLAVVHPDPDDRVELPVTAVPPSLPASLLQGRSIGFGGEGPRLLGLWSAKRKRTRLFWAYSEDEFPSMQVAGTDGALRISYSVPLAARMRAGAAIRWKGDSTCELGSDWFGALARFQNWWKELGVEVPRDRPRWAERPLLYETQIGAAVFERGSYEFNPYPTMEALIRNLDYIRKLGFNTLQIMPRHPSPSYAVDDYYDPARQFGGARELKQLVAEAHRRGMRVILDWLVHGVIDQEVARKTSSLVASARDEGYQHRGLADYVLNFTPYWLRMAPPASALRLRHPEWFMRFENGSMGHIYTWAFDLENAALQDYIIGAMEFYLRDYGVDGFRVDAPTWNSFANWDPNLSYRASRSTTGAIRLFDRALPILRKTKPDLMMYTEPATAVFRRMFDSNYSYDELWMFDPLLAWRKQASQTQYRMALEGQEPLTAYQARLWLENRRRSMPPGIVTIHQVDSHDSFWWLPPGEKFRREQFGMDGYRALLFMIATLDGGMMHYATGEQGNEDYMRRVLALREQLPELKDGRCEYLKVRVSDDHVFAVSWQSAAGVAIPLTNLGRAPVKVHVQVPLEEFGLDLRGRYTVSEVFSRKPVGELRDLAVSLAPLECALIVIRKP